jgi:hypothetical protein
MGDSRGGLGLAGLDYYFSLWILEPETWMWEVRGERLDRGRLSWSSWEGVEVGTTIRRACLPGVLVTISSFHK